MMDSKLIKLILTDRKTDKSDNPRRQIKIIQLEVTNIHVYNLHQLHKSIAKSFPRLFGHTYSLHWIDKNSDQIVIDDAEDFRFCLMLTANIADILITPTTTAIDNFRYRLPCVKIICDGCNESIYGSSFKCLQCEDYDLCDFCFGEIEHESDHRFKLTFNNYDGESDMHIGSGDVSSRCSITQMEVRKLKTINRRYIDAFTQTDVENKQNNVEVQTNKEEMIVDKNEAQQPLTVKEKEDMTNPPLIIEESEDSLLFQSMTIITNSDVENNHENLESDVNSEDEWSVVDEVQIVGIST